MPSLTVWSLPALIAASRSSIRWAISSTVPPISMRSDTEISIILRRLCLTLCENFSRDLREFRRHDLEHLVDSLDQVVCFRALLLSPGLVLGSLETPFPGSSTYFSLVEMTVLGYAILIWRSHFDCDLANNERLWAELLVFGQPGAPQNKIIDGTVYRGLSMQVPMHYSGRFHVSDQNHANKRQPHTKNISRLRINHLLSQLYYYFISYCFIICYIAKFIL